VQELIYNPGLLPLGRTFNSTTFETSFNALVPVDVQVVSAIVDPSLIVVFFDNHAYTAHLTS